MENPANIDRLIREKFEQYSPPPPSHIWEGIQAGIAGQAKPGFFALHGRKVAAAAVILLLVSAGLWLALPGVDDVEVPQETTQIDNDNASQSEGAAAIHPEDETGVPDIVESPAEPVVADAEANIEPSGTAPGTGEPEDRYVTPAPPTAEMATAETPTETGAVSEGETSENVSTDDRSLQSPLRVNSMASAATDLQNNINAAMIGGDQNVRPLQFTAEKPSGSKWSHGLYFSPEINLNDFDSIRILPAYALSYEPTFHFSDHWFVRFGAGLSYSRERGFARLDYVSNEVVGTYEDVYDVTFDTIAGAVVPTFHTKTTEVWDSVRHVQVTEVTNKYLYLQTPVLFGYYNSNPKFNWYFYGGPAFSMLIGKSIQKPEEGLGEADIINLENNLPNRSDFYMQLWIGGGIEYKLGNQFAIAFEPNYRYHFDRVYDDPRLQSALSGFSLRFGVVFTMK